MPPSARVLRCESGSCIDHAGVAGVVDGVAEPGRSRRRRSSSTPPSLSRLGSLRDPVHRVALDPVAVRVVDEDLLAEVAVDPVVLHDAVLRARAEQHAELVVGDRAVRMVLPLRPSSASKKLHAGDGVAVDRRGRRRRCGSCRSSSARPSRTPARVPLRTITLRAPADADAGREAFLLARGVLDQVVRAVDRVAVRSTTMFEAPITRPSPGQLSRSLPTSVLAVSTCPQLTVVGCVPGRQRRRERRRRRGVRHVAQPQLRAASPRAGPAASRGWRSSGRRRRIGLDRVTDLPAVALARLDHRFDVGLDVPLGGSPRPRWSLAAGAFRHRAGSST